MIKLVPIIAALIALCSFVFKNGVFKKGDFRKWVFKKCSLWAATATSFFKIVGLFVFYLISHLKRKKVSIEMKIIVINFCGLIY
tara:strand:+ start:10789 stop:11040 length:252 start_codon:yes stop_codon:yes gene_type:complete